MPLTVLEAEPIRIVTSGPLSTNWTVASAPVGLETLTPVMLR